MDRRPHGPAAGRLRAAGRATGDRAGGAGGTPGGLPRIARGTALALDEEAEDVVTTAIDFGADYNHGAPLRWGPVVVEIFSTSSLGRKVAGERAFFERVPYVLADWVAYASRRRGMAEEPLGEVVAAVELPGRAARHGGRPGGLGPAKAFTVAAQ